MVRIKGKDYQVDKYDCEYCGNKFEAVSGRRDSSGFKAIKNNIKCPNCKNGLPNKM